MKKIANKKIEKANITVSFFSMVLIFFSLFSYSNECAAQMNAKTHQASNPSELYRDTEVPTWDKAAKIVEVNAVSDGKQTYICWSVTNQKKNGTYLIERSEDGSYYTIEGLEKGVPTKRKQTGSFGFVKNDTPQGTIYYRIRHIANDNSILLSENVILENKIAD